MWTVRPARLPVNSVGEDVCSWTGDTRNELCTRVNGRPRVSVFYRCKDLSARVGETVGPPVEVARRGTFLASPPLDWLFDPERPGRGRGARARARARRGQGPEGLGRAPPLLRPAASAGPRVPSNGRGRAPAEGDEGGGGEARAGGGGGRAGARAQAARGDFQRARGSASARVREAARPAAAACASRVAAQQGLSSRRRRRRPPALPRPPTWGCPGSWTLQKAAEDARGAPEPAERAGLGVRSRAGGGGRRGGGRLHPGGGPGPGGSFAARPGRLTVCGAARPPPQLWKLCVCGQLRARGAGAPGRRGRQASSPGCPPRGVPSRQHLRGPGLWRGAERRRQGARIDERARPGWWRWVFEPLFKSLY
jgi:hypothetical protein